MEQYFSCWFPREKDHCHTKRLLRVPIRGGSLGLWFVTLSDFGSFASYFILHRIYWGTRSVDIHEVGLVVFYHFLIIDSQILERQRRKVANLPSLQKGRAEGGRIQTPLIWGHFQATSTWNTYLADKCTVSSPQRSRVIPNITQKSAGSVSSTESYSHVRPPPMPSSSTHIFCNFSPFAFHQCMKWSWSYNHTSLSKISRPRSSCFLCPGSF